jgi:superfamily II DNA/RNA helicase
MTREFYEQFGHRPLASWQCAGVSRRLRFAELLEERPSPASGDPAPETRARRAISQALLYGNISIDSPAFGHPRRASALHSLRKIICRGDLTPVARGVDDAIFAVLDQAFGGHDIGSANEPPLVQRVMRWASARSARLERPPLSTFDDDPPRGAGGERMIWELLCSGRWPGLQTWLHPQIKMGVLLGEPENEKRPDFVMAPPWSRPCVWEAHGHKSAHDVAKSDRFQRDRWMVFDWIVPEEPIDTGRIKKSLDLMLADRPDPASPAESFVLDAAWVASQVECVTLWMLASGAVGSTPRTIAFTCPTRFNAVVDAALAELKLMLETLDQIWALTGDEKLSQHQLHRHRDSTDSATHLVHIDPDASSYLAFDHAIEEGQLLVRRVYLPADLSPSPIEKLTHSSRPERLAKAPKEGELRPILSRVFGLSDFRAGQVAAIQRAVANRDALVLFPTGHGKSLVFQFASLLTPGPALVVEPFTALIDDQERNLRLLGFGRIAALHGRKPRQARPQSELLKNADIVYVAPERLHRTNFIDDFIQLIETRGFGLFVIDEAHTVSQFGHSFRPSYLDIVERIGSCCERAGCEAPPVLALTATAPQRVVQDVQALLRISSAPVSLDELAGDGFARRGHLDEILAFSAFGTDEQVPSLEQLLSRIMSGKSLPEGQGIVFCPSKGKISIAKSASRMSYFGAQGVRQIVRSASGKSADQVGIYTGGKKQGAVSPQNMSEFARKFSDGQIPIMVATSAFGTGVNLQGVKWTIHVGMPAGLEAYYQETGRAGRDGKGAFSLLLVDWDSSTEILQYANLPPSGDPLVALRDRVEELERPASIARQLRLLVGDELPVPKDGIQSPLRGPKWVDGREELDDVWLPSFPGVNWEIDHVATHVHAQLSNPRPGSVRDVQGHTYWAELMHKSVHRLATLGVIAHGFSCEDHGDNDVVVFKVRFTDALGLSSLIDQSVAEVRRVTSSEDRAETVRKSLESRLNGLAFPEQLTECSRALLESVYRVVYETRVFSLHSLANYARETSQELRQRYLHGYFAPSGFKRDVFELCKSRANIEVLRQSQELLDAEEVDIAAIEAAAAEYPASLVPRFLLSLALVANGKVSEASQYLVQLAIAEDTPWEVRRWGIGRVLDSTEGPERRQQILNEFGRRLPGTLSVTQVTQLTSMLRDDDGASEAAAQLVHQFVSLSLGA